MEEWAPAGTGAHPKSSRQSHNVRAARPPLFSVGRVVINDFATRALSPPSQCARSRVAPTGVADLGMGTAPVSIPGPDEQSREPMGPEQVQLTYYKLSSARRLNRVGGRTRLADGAASEQVALMGVNLN